MPSFVSLVGEERALSSHEPDGIEEDEEQKHGRSEGGCQREPSGVSKVLRDGSEKRGPQKGIMIKIHPQAEVSAEAEIGDGTMIWRNVQIREKARIGRECIIGQGVYVEYGVVIGDRVKIQNNSSLYNGLTLEDGVFIGPHVVFTNDKLPRGINPDGTLKSADDWTVGSTLVRYGAAIGACAVVVTGVTVGRWAMIGSGAVVTKDVPDHALVVGNPARVVGWVSATGKRCDTQDQASAVTKTEQVEC